MKHPIRGDGEIHRKTYEAVCNKIKKYYGVSDAELFFKSRRDLILNKCKPDEFGWASFNSLHDWHAHLVLKSRFAASGE